MNEYRCPVCGGELVWDYERGEVTCSRCGLVVDRIYYYGPPRMTEEVREKERESLRRHYPKRNKEFREYRIHRARYYMARKYVEDKPWLEVDYDKVIETGKMIHSIKSKATIEAEKNIGEKDLWEPINRTLKLIEETYPIALARTKRSKYALAYIVYKYIKEKKYPSDREVVEIFKISGTSYKRLLKVADKIINILTAKPVAIQ